MAVASRRLAKELQDIMKNGMPTGITLLKADNFEEWFLQIEVLGESLYVGEKFCIRFVFESQYPIASPQVTFVTTDGWKAPLHPHVYTNGHCCLSILGPEWSPVLTVSSVCLSLQSMLASSKEKSPPQDNDRYIRSAPLNPKKTRFHYDDDTFYIVITPSSWDSSRVWTSLEKPAPVRPCNTHSGLWRCGWDCLASWTLSLVKAAVDGPEHRLEQSPHTSLAPETQLTIGSLSQSQNPYSASCPNRSQLAQIFKERDQSQLPGRKIDGPCLDTSPTIGLREMVFVNEVKYACQSCIKGHRSSSCHHTDRPLFEIKKKGRPITQCEECRELRKSRRLHVKCHCDGRRVPEEENVVLQSSRPISGSGKKTVRKIPTIPALPNGLKDVISRNPLGPAHTKSKITSLLNPCECYDKAICNCTSAVSFPNSAESSQTSSVAAHPSLAGPARNDTTDQRKRRKEDQIIGPYPVPIRSCCANKRKLAIQRDRDRASLVGALFAPASAASSSREPVLPLRTPTKFAPLPIFVSPPTTVATTANTITEPEQEPMEWTCQCGARCLCLGCKRHQGENASDEPGVLCNENCPTCVDSELGPEMPTILGRASPVGVRLHHRRTHSRSVSGTSLGVASFAAYEEDAAAGLGDLGWEDAEGSPDPEFLELPPVVEECHSPDVKVEDDKKKRGLGLQVELPKLPQKAAPVTKHANIVTTNAGGLHARRL